MNGSPGGTRGRHCEAAEEKVNGPNENDRLNETKRNRRHQAPSSV